MTPERLVRLFAADQRGTLTTCGFKLDGHTRAVIWTMGLAPGVPEQLRCEVFIARD